MKKNIKGYVYLIHFARPYRHARHYLGFATDLAGRIAEHGSGRGARLMAVIFAAGIPWEVARVWHGDRAFERSLKKRKGTPRLCPVCNTSIRAVVEEEDVRW